MAPKPKTCRHTKNHEAQFSQELTLVVDTPGFGRCTAFFIAKFVAVTVNFVLFPRDNNATSDSATFIVTPDTTLP